MTSVISICSNALLMLGASTISSLDEDSDSARLCSNLWPGVRDALLRRHAWNCAIKRRLLAPLTEAPAFGWRAQFQIPEDCLRVLVVRYDDGPPIPYELESMTILANVGALPLRYVWRNDDPATWDALLIRGAEMAMAATLAYPITRDKGEQEMREKLLDIFIKEARAVDGVETPAQQVGDERLLRAGY